MKVQDLNGELVTLVQSLHEVASCNNDNGTDYNYFWIEWDSQCNPLRLYGGYSVCLDSQVDLIGGL